MSHLLDGQKLKQLKKKMKLRIFLM